MKRREFLRELGAAAGVGPMLFLSAAGTVEVRPKELSVRHFGAVGDGARLETKALHEAIDQCAQTGGGTV